MKTPQDFVDALLILGEGWGFRLVKKDYFTATLARADGAKLEISSDRSSWPAASLDITPPGASNGYGVWLLMNFMEPATIPTWPEQLRFLTENIDLLLTNEGNYRERYLELDSSDEWLRGS